MNLKFATPKYSRRVSIADRLNDALEIVQQYAKPLVVAGALISVVALAYVGYRGYMSAREQKAQLALIHHMQQYHQAMQDASSYDWDHFAQALQSTYEQFKNSQIAPYIAAVHADVLTQANAHQAALQSIKTAADTAPTRSPLKHLFKTRYALMMTDSEDQEHKADGLKILTELANDQNNIYRDMALFYLGKYHWAHDDKQSAENAWTELINTFYENQVTPSPWAAQAKPLLDLIV